MAELITQSNINNVISVNDIVLPQCAYSSGHYNNQKITVFYISDIHLHFHVDKSKNVRMQIRKIIRELISGKLEEMITRSSKFIVLFGGDVSVDTKWNEIFYYEFYVRWNYILYKKWRSYNAYALPMSQARARKIYNEELERLQNEKDIAVDKLKRWMKYDKRHQRMSTYEVIEKAKNKGLPEYIE